MFIFDRSHYSLQFTSHLAYDIINRKLFSLPKLLILPGVIARQPMLLVKIFPFIFVTDMVKGRMVAFVTDMVEQFQREARDINSVRQKVEQFDMKNAELVSSICHGVSSCMDYTDLTSLFALLSPFE